MRILIILDNPFVASNGLWQLKQSPGFCVQFHVSVLNQTVWLLDSCWKTRSSNKVVLSGRPIFSDGAGQRSISEPRGSGTSTNIKHWIFWKVGLSFWIWQLIFGWLALGSILDSDVFYNFTKKKFRKRFFFDNNASTHRKSHILCIIFMRLLQNKTKVSVLFCGHTNASISPNWH